MGYFITHIKPDSVYIIILNPVLADLAEILNHFFIISIQLWHPIGKCERIKTSVSGIRSLSDLLPVFNHEPIRIAGILPIFQYIHPWSKFSSTVVEYGIHHDSNPFFVCLFTEYFHGISIAKRRINFRIICCIIFVV